MQIKVAVIGSGNIGVDLVERMRRDSNFEIKYFIGRRADSPGLQRFAGSDIELLSKGSKSLRKIISQVDGVFDATSAFDHQEHAAIAASAEKWIVDLTPSKLGIPISPLLINKVTGMEISKNKSANYSMVTCGGQSSALLLYAAASGSNSIQEVEISSSIAALSAGMATRRNIDEYVTTTENLGKILTSCENVKAILVLNPAEPPVMMRTTIHVRAEQFDIDRVNNVLDSELGTLQKYVPGYQITVSPTLLNPNLITLTAQVTGAGYYLPEYAGNLDIINAAAVETAKRHFQLSGRS